MKRHINYKMTKVHIILICNFQIILFSKYQGEHLEVFLRVYLFISQLQYLEWMHIEGRDDHVAQKY